MLTEHLQQQAQAIADAYQPPPTGRPSAIGDADALTELLEQIAAGASRDAACQVAGISTRTLSRMIERAEAGEIPESAFVKLLKRAEGLVEAKVTKNVIKASESPQFWAAGMTYLERKYPERWGRRQESNDGPKVVVQIGVKASDIQGLIFAVQPSLSPATANDLACANVGQVEMLSPITNPPLTALPAATSGARSPEGPQPVPAAGRQQTAKRKAKRRAGGLGKEKRGQPG